MEMLRMLEQLRAYRVLMELSFRAAPRESIMQLISGVIFQLEGPAVAFGAKLIIDAAIVQDLRMGLIAAGGLALLTGSSLILVFYYVDWLFTVFDRTTAMATRRLIRLIGGTHGLAHERPEYLDQIQRIREETRSLGGMVNATAGLLRVVAALTFTGFLLARVHPALLLLPAFGVLSFWLGKKSRDLDVAAQEKTTEAERLRRHLFEIGTAASQGKELRMSQLNDVILQQHHAVAGQVLQVRNRATWQGALLKTLDGLISGLSFAGAITLALVLTVNGRATPGDVVLTVGLAAQMTGIVFTAIAYGTNLLWVLKVAKRFLWLEEYASTSAPAIDQPVTAPDRLNKGIEVRDLSFQYPESARPVLEGLSLRLPAGKVVALVGENGAGKTTLIKLLCDFYQPSGGQILVDEVDLDRIPPEDWRSRLSAAFQDFSRFEFLARETVGIADLPRMEDRHAVMHALQRSGAGDLPDSLPQGLDTQLGTAWENGVELSGGQWQKLALGRGLMRNHPLLVVFDEPTAALDAPTEHALFERFAEAARAGQTDGTITLLVSHRFSTVRMADLIVVLDGGKLRECGSHEELMSAGGLYAELYELQSQAYR
jgi:ATP-binding cassette, subfamily B, bacterial